MAAISGPNIPLDGLVLNIDPASALSYPARNDPYRDQIILLLDGTSFTDKSRNNFTITVNGDAQIVSDSIFGNAMSFDGNGDYINFNAQNDFIFGLDDWTIEGWINRSQDKSVDQIIDFRGNTQNGSYPSLALINGKLALYVQTATRLLSTTTLSINEWYHIAAVRKNGITKIYINGINEGGSWADTNNYGVGTDRPYMGKNGGNPSFTSEDFSGLIGPFKITKGARYTANFNPSRQFNLLPLKIKDIKNDTLGTFTNGPVYSSTQKGIVSFIGANVGSAGTSIRFSNNSTYDVQSSNFSICAWCNPKEQLNYGIIAGKWGGYGVSNLKSFALRQDNGQHFQFGISSNGSTETLVTNSATFSLGEWYHICATRDGNNVYLYTNGVVTSSGSFSGSVYTSSTDFTVGAANNNTDTFKGNISDVKLYNRGLSSNEVKKMYTATRERFVEIPKTISGLQLWLDAADLSTLRQNSNGTTAVTLSSDPVGYWADKSGNGRHATQASAGSRPSLLVSAINSLPSINFSTTTYHRLNYTNFSSSDKTIFIVHQGLSSSLDTRLLTVNTDYKLNIGASTYSGNNLSFVREAIVWTNSAFSRIYNPTIFKVTYTNSPSFSANISRYTASGLSNVQTYTSTGSGSDGDYLSQAGYYAEVISYNRILTDEEHNKVRNYLNKKWGVF